MKYLIETQVRENYAAHDEDYKHGIDAPYWKNKSGSRYIVEAPGEHIDVAYEVADLITSSNEMFEETIFDVTAVEDDYESEYVKDQKRYDPEGYDTLYLDNIIRQGKSGDWYMKRGYIVGGFQKGTEYDHLVGKFIGNIDNLTKGKCVMKVTDNKKEYI